MNEKISYQDIVKENLRKHDNLVIIPEEKWVDFSDKIKKQGKISSQDFGPKLCDILTGWDDLSPHNVYLFPGKEVFSDAITFVDEFNSSFTIESPEFEHRIDTKNHIVMSVDHERGVSFRMEYPDHWSLADVFTEIVNRYE